MVEDLQKPPWVKTGFYVWRATGREAESFRLSFPNLLIPFFFSKFMIGPSLFLVKSDWVYFPQGGNSINL